MAASKKALVYEADKPKDKELVVSGRITPEESEEIAAPVLVIEEALKKNDISLLLDYGKALNRALQLRGVVKAHLLYQSRVRWPELVQKGLVQDDWFNVIQAEWGVTPQNAKKYADAWERLIIERRIPDKYRDTMLRKPIEHWLAIAPASVDGLSDSQWKAIITARQRSELRQVIEQVRGRRTSSANRLVLVRRRAKEGENSMIQAWRGKSKPSNVALLFDSPKDLENEVVRDAIDRLLSAAGVVQE